jgi:hypothetical protein
MVANFVHIHKVFTVPQTMLQKVNKSLKVLSFIITQHLACMICVGRCLVQVSVMAPTVVTDILWSFSAPPSECQDNAAKQATAAFCHIPLSPLLIHSQPAIALLLVHNLSSVSK